MYPRFHLKKLTLVEAATKHQVPSLKILGYQNQDVLKTSNHTGEHIKHVQHIIKITTMLYTSIYTILNYTC